LLAVFFNLVSIAIEEVARTNGQDPSVATSALVGAGLTLLAEVIFYWRLTHHFRVVATAQPAPTPPAELVETTG
jgi:hypothetical protein